MRTDRQTDMTKLIVAFRNFANSPKMHKPEQLTLQNCKPFAITVQGLMFQTHSVIWQYVLSVCLISETGVDRRTKQIIMPQFKRLRVNSLKTKQVQNISVFAKTLG
jgi:hypothetical protein